MTKTKNKAAMAVDDATSSVTAVTDDDAMTLVDLFGDLDVEELTEPDNRTTSGESASIASSEVSTDVADSEVDLKTKPSEKGKTADTESKVATEAETSSGVTSEAASSEVAETLASGETASEDKTTTDDTSSKSGDASAGAQSSSAGEWTDSEDALIISMKEGGESWASIGNAINRGKNEVKKRWHVLKINVANSTESGGESIQAGSQADTEADDKTAVSQDEAKKADDDKCKSKAERKAERKAEKQKQKNNETLKADGKPKKSQKPFKEVKITEGKKLEAKKSEPKPKEPRQRSNPSKPTPSETSSSKPATSDSNEETPSSSYRDRFNLLHDTSSASVSKSSATSADDNDADPQAKYERELAGQQRYIRRHVHPALYPPAPAASHKRKRPLPAPASRRAPSPADRQQRRDDATLAAVVSKREATKWLEMQANFFNATGRMVPLHMIKSRCEAEEDRGKAAGVRSWASSVADSEDLLDPNEGRDAPEDALVNDDED